MSVNIGESNAGDAFYRYKMPKLQSRIQGRGNGIKTEVVNNVEIAKALDRLPEYIIKFYGCELGAQTNFDKKTGTSIVNGAHDTKKLVELLEGFIKKYVQCYSCGNPETVIKIKREAIRLKCKACGSDSAVDMMHRLNTYILKNPPEEKMSKEEKKLQKLEKERMKEAAGDNLDKEEKKKKKKDKDKKKKGKTEGSASPTGEDEEDDEEEDGGKEEEVMWMTDTSAAAAEKRAQEQLSAAMASMVTQGNIEAEQAAAKKREEKRKAEEDAARKAVEDAERKAREEEERKVQEAADLKAKLEEEARAAEATSNATEKVRASLGKDTPKATAQLLNSFTVENGPAQRMTYLFEAILEDSSDRELALNIKAHRDVLRLFAKDAPGQIAQLIALENFLGVTNPGQIKSIPQVLTALYENDIVEDDIILAWHNHGGTAKSLGVLPADAEKVRKAAAPFVEWLEEEGESESEEESDEE